MTRRCFAPLIRVKREHHFCSTSHLYWSNPGYAEPLGILGTGLYWPDALPVTQPTASKHCDTRQFLQEQRLVGRSLMSLFSTNMAISETTQEQSTIKVEAQSPSKQLSICSTDSSSVVKRILQLIKMKQQQLRGWQ